ncbi:MAG: tRNA lysidine(34) synthetase TilS [Clostridiales Family XIII bacterium]|jgi:tRNA(Ile)-lysidine synthase|nr:tRNA lysidine(34) synthetase TilS [Clostridiales Family XIII bacterium]
MEHQALSVIKKTIADHALIEAGAEVVVGLSGGPDSACLFHALASLRGEWGFGLSAVHVTHGLRPGAAQVDARIAEELCRAHGAPFFGFARDVGALARARGVGEEEAGRDARYEAFRETAARVAEDKALPRSSVRIAVAHNRNDQAETVLLRILRGTGPDGLAAMPYIRESREGFAVIRPLLDVPRALVEAYCAAVGLAPARDRSNEKTVYVRNRIRLSLLPELERDYNENAIEALVRLASHAAEDRAYFDEITGALLKEGRATTDGGFEMPLAPFSEVHVALRRRLIVRCFERAGLAQDIAAVHLRAADALIEGGRTGKTVEFPNGYRLSLRYGRLLFFAADRAPAPVRAVPRERRLPLAAFLAGTDGKADGAANESGAAGGSAIADSETTDESRADDNADRADPAGGERELCVFSAEAGAYAIRFSLRILSRVAAAGTKLTPEVSRDAASDPASAPEASGPVPGPKSAPEAPGASHGLVALDFDALAAAHDAVSVRGRRAGDFIRPAGMDGAKLIQDLFTDAKLPRGERDAVPLIAADSEVLCVLAAGRLGRKTGNYAPGPATRRILRIAYDEKEENT